MTAPAALVCFRCGTRLGDTAPWCPTCQDKMLAVGVTTTTQPEPIREPQRITICVLFRELGVMHKATRMRDLSTYVGRTVSDYDQLTAAEATTAAHKLRERANGVRR